MSDENDASSSPPFGEPGFSPLRKTVKSYGISIDSSRIHEVAYEEQPETLRELGVNVFDQHVFEEGIYQQVDEAIAEQEALACKKRLENELKTVEEDQRTGQKQQKRKLSKQDKLQDKHQENEDSTVQRHGTPTEGQDCHYDKETTDLGEYGENEESEISNENNSAEKLFRMGSQEETEVERLIRLGEMTPFGSKVDFKERMVDNLTEASSGERDEKEPDHLKKDKLLGSQVDKGVGRDGGHDSGGDITGGGEDGDFNFLDGHDAEGEGTSTSVLESDDDYIPDEEELKLSWEDDQVLHSDHDDVGAEEDHEEPIVKAKKVKKRKVLKKSTRLKHTEDDGDDRLYQIRIRFQQELETYCNGFESSLSKFNQQVSVDTSEVFKDLENWYDINVLYVCRCTKVFQLQLASLINVGLLGETLSISDCEDNLKEDIDRFVDVCSLSSLLSTPVIQESNHKLLEDMAKQSNEDNKDNKLSFSESDFKFELSCNDICEVCHDWAKIMVGGELDNPVFLKQVMENYKLKVIQDMNSLKRLLMEAETNHYALFRAYVFLSKCHSSMIVMEHIREEAKMSASKDMFSIIKVLEEFIFEKGGFSKIRSI